MPFLHAGARGSCLSVKETVQAYIASSWVWLLGACRRAGDSWLLEVGRLEGS